MRSWALGTPGGDWVSMGIPSDGAYGITPGVIYGYPVTCKNGKYAIVQGLATNDFSRARMDATDKELREERASVEHLLGRFAVMQVQAKRRPWPPFLPSK